jgi:D-glycero-D-manno-heptose 1,7-bisphosphate phosphatase
MKRAVFLDRDGVINEAVIKLGLPTSPIRIDEIRILAGVKKAIEMLQVAEYEIVVVTNQPDVSRGKVQLEKILEMNNFLAKSLGIEQFFTCFHDDHDRCPCRKPRSGMLLQAARELNLDLNRSFLVGDRWKDIIAGQSVGCKCFFIDYGYLEPRPIYPYVKVESLLEAAQLILGDEYVKY